MPFKHKADRDAWREKNKDRIRLKGKLVKQRLRNDPEYKAKEALASREYYERNKRAVLATKLKYHKRVNPLYGTAKALKSRDPERVIQAINDLCQTHGRISQAAGNKGNDS